MSNNLIDEKPLPRNITLTSHEMRVLKYICNEHMEILSEMGKPLSQERNFEAAVITGLLGKLNRQ